MLDFASCERLVSSARDKRSKPYANNTRVEKRDEDTYILRLHATDIATFHRDGRVTLNSGGWRTVTTMDRLRAVTSHLYSERGQWYVDAEPDVNDSSPPRGERTVLKPFEALNPGPEPVKPAEGCVAGEIHAVPYSEEKLVTRGDMEKMGITDEDIVRPYDGSYFVGYTPVYGTIYTYYGEESYSYSTDYHARIGAEYETCLDDRTRYEQCPHCKLFDAQHRAWDQAMNGDRWGRNRAHGYAAMVENLERYGTREAWHEAYLADYRQTREERKAHKEWLDRNRVPFQDDMEITSEGYAPRPDVKAIKQAKKQLSAIDRKKKRINIFITNAVNELVTNGVPMPSGSDCWYCSLRDVHTGTTWGDLGDHAHLADHMREHYYVPSMFVNAMREAGYRDAGIYMLLGMDPENDRMGGQNASVDLVTRALRRYLYKRLIPELGSNAIPPQVGSTGRYHG